MRYILLATHANLAFGFIDAVKLIAGEQQAQRVFPLCMTLGKQPEDFIRETAAFLEDKQPEDEYLIFCDLYGASPCNSALMGFRYTNYRVITGVNLGVILEALCIIDMMSLDELSDQLVQRGKEGIVKIHIQS